MTSQQLSERANAIRRETAFRLEKILERGSHYNKWLPTYKIEIHDPSMTAYYFVPLDTSKKGKRRIYTTRGAIPNPSDLFLSYMSHKDINRLEHSLKSMTLERAVKHQRRIGIFGDRWVLTKGKPVCKIKSVAELWARFRAVEIRSSKFNHPPEGCAGTTYAVNSDYLPDFSGPVPKIVCRLIRLHKGVNHDRGPHLGMH